MFWLVVVVVPVGCAPSPTEPDAGPTPQADAGNEVDAGDDVDAGDTLDAGLWDAGTIDAGRSDAGAGDAGTEDAGGMDAGATDDGFGVLSGECGVLAAEVSSPSPSFFVTHIDFGDDPFDEGVDDDQLTAGGREIIADGNAGGSSLYSEVFAYEVLARCDDAALLKTETEVVYDVEGKITDFLVQIGDDKVGVSVTRAVGFPRDDPYTVMQATSLLADKLADVLESSANVAAEDAWVKQVLHVIAYGEMHATSLRTAWDGLSDDVKADTVLMVTVSDGDDAFLY